MHFYFISNICVIVKKQQPVVFAYNICPRYSPRLAKKHRIPTISLQNLLSRKCYRDLAYWNKNVGFSKQVISFTGSN